MRCIAIAGLFSVFIVPAHADTTGCPTVIDGDTIAIRGERIRRSIFAVRLETHQEVMTGP